MLTPRRIVIGMTALIFAVVLADMLLPPPLDRAGEISALVTDREGKPLRAFPTSDGRWRFHGDLDKIDPEFIEALIRVEDKRFRAHRGTDWAGLGRALIDSVRAGRVVSGGSTITMQTARMLEPRDRTVGSKLIEIARAWQIERRLSKDEILALYLTLTPYGGNLEGVRAASWSYFGHEADKLSKDETALLIALPQSPEARRPDRHPEAAERARNWVAEKLNRYDVYTAGDVEDTLAQVFPLKGRNVENVDIVPRDLCLVATRNDDASGWRAAIALGQEPQQFATRLVVEMEVFKCEQGRKLLTRCPENSHGRCEEFPPSNRRLELPKATSFVLKELANAGQISLREPETL